MEIIKLTEKKDVAGFILMCCLVYWAGYVTRINFAATVSEIVLAEGFKKSAAGMVTTASFASYGVGQLISGVLGDRINPRLFMFLGLAVTAVLNLMMPFCPSIELMAVLWLLNGLAQSALWPPLVKTMSVCLNELDFQRGCMGVSIASCVGTVAVYFMVPICISISGWKLVFYLSSIIGMLVAVLWLLLTRKAQKCLDAAPKADTKKQTAKIADNGKDFKKILISSGLVSISAAILIHGVLKDGITTWFPSYLIEMFRLDSRVAILCAVLLPLMGIIGMQLASIFYYKLGKNEMRHSALFFGFSLLCSIVMTAFPGASPLLSVPLAALINSCMYAVNIMLICMAPARFIQYGKVSTVSGFLNFFTYVGSAVASYAFAKLSEVCGWPVTIFTWAVLSLAGMLFCIKGCRKWQLQWKISSSRHHIHK